MEIKDKYSIYHIFLEIQRLHYIKLHKATEKIGISHGQPPVLFILSEEDGQSQNEIATKLNVKASTLAVMLQRMEKSELIEKRLDEKDQRVSRVYITKKGEELAERAKSVLNKMELTCFNNLTMDEKVILRRLLLQIHENLLEEKK